MAKGIAMVMWRGSSRLAQLIKYNIAQYKSVDELISDIGPEAIDLQTYDNDPTSLIPSHLPNELNTDESRYTKAQRARWFLERIGIVSTPMQLLDITQMQEKMLWMFLYQKGAQLPQSAYMEKFGVTPDKMVEVQALIGDSTDNVPGVPGIGPKTAAQLVNEFGDLESVLAAAEMMKPSKRRDMLIEHAAAARLSRELVTLRADAPMPLPIDQLAPRDLDQPRLKAWLATMGFRSIAVRLGLEPKEEAGAGETPGKPQSELGRMTRPRPVAGGWPGCRRPPTCPW